MFDRVKALHLSIMLQGRFNECVEIYRLSDDEVLCHAICTREITRIKEQLERHRGRRCRAVLLQYNILYEVTMANLPCHEMLANVRSSAS
jgi:hypothetical protein